MVAASAQQLLAQQPPPATLTSAAVFAQALQLAHEACRCHPSAAAAAAGASPQRLLWLLSVGELAACMTAAPQLRQHAEGALAAVQGLLLAGLAGCNEPGGC